MGEIASAGVLQRVVDLGFYASSSAADGVVDAGFDLFGEDGGVLDEGDADFTAFIAAAAFTIAVGKFHIDEADVCVEALKCIGNAAANKRLERTSEGDFSGGDEYPHFSASQMRHHCLLSFSCSAVRGWRQE